MLRDKPRVAVLISGRGTNMASLVKASSGDDYPATIELVISNNPFAPGLNLARDLGVATDVIDHRLYGAERMAHEGIIDKRLRQLHIDYVCLAGYMRRLTDYFVGAWAERLMNIHPSLLPAFPGLNTHSRAIAAGVCVHGCTVHLVTEQLDSGPIIAQGVVPVLPTDTEASLASRVLTIENALYPAALASLIRKGLVARPLASTWLSNPLPYDHLAF